MAESLMKIENISLAFGGVMPLSDVSVEIEVDRLHAIIGQNGAGKTSLINCINGVYKIQTGRILFKGEDISGLPAHERARLGIARTFQNVALFREMTVLDNLMLGRIAVRKLPITGVFKSIVFRGLESKNETHDRIQVERIIEFLELAPLRKKVVSSLPFGTQKLVELGRALAMNPSVLILDEPTSGMSVGEKLNIVRCIHSVRRSLGVSIILIEHDMNIVMGISDWISVLDYGNKIAEGKPEEIQQNADVIAAYLGKKKSG